MVKNHTFAVGISMLHWNSQSRTFNDKLMYGFQVSEYNRIENFHVYGAILGLCNASLVRVRYGQLELKDDFLEVSWSYYDLSQTTYYLTWPQNGKYDRKYDRLKYDRLIARTYVL